MEKENDDEQADQFLLFVVEEDENDEVVLKHHARIDVWSKNITKLASDYLRVR